MDDLISRRAAIEAVVYELDMIDHVPQRIFDRLTRRIKELPSIFQPQKGKWIKDIKKFGDNAYHCSQCGAVLEKDDLEWRNNYYCYHCGADMREGSDILDE